MALVCLCRGNFYWPPHTTILFCSIFLDKIVLDTLKSRYHRSAPLGIANDEDKKRITRNILEELPEWFGIPEAREEYIRDSAGKVFFCAMENEKDLGFLYLKETGKDTVELAVMGVLEEYHRKGIGKELFNRAKKAAKEMGYSFIQVKTVQMGKYKSYDDTNRFYISIGFKEFEVFPTLWDKWNPCQIYVMGI